MSSSLDERMLAVIEGLYDAALDETLWPGALGALTEYTGSQAATFWTLDGSEQPRLPILENYNFDPAFVSEYLDTMVPRDPTVQYLVQHPDQGIIHDGLVITEREKDRHHYYDWHGRHSDTRFRMVGQARPAPEVQAGVTLHRTHEAGRYETGDLQRFGFIYGHLRRALAIGFRVGSLAAANQASADVLDSNPAAIVLLNEQRRAYFFNRAAETMRNANDGLQLSSVGVRLSRREDQARLDDLISGVLSGIAPADTAGGFLRARRPSGKRPYAIVVASLRRLRPLLAGALPAVCILITDPEAKAPLAAARLRNAFGLTGAEAKLAVALGSGEGLRAAALKLGITYGTARTCLGEIFQKTQTRRQAELVSVLLTTLAMR
jgi:DNA-binding CsgD family transcriptional regulator